MAHRDNDFDDRDFMEMQDDPTELELTDGLEIYDDGELILAELEDIAELDELRDE